MSEQIPASVSLWRELRKYLKVETITSETEIISNKIPKTNYEYTSSIPPGLPVEVVHIKIAIYNTAPWEPNWPLIVFTGVGIWITPLTEDVPKIPWYAEFSNLLIKKPSLHGRCGHPPLLVEPSSRSFQELTEEEGRQGIALFPGDLVTIELTMPTVDIPNYAFNVASSLSHRHFFHYQEKLTVSFT